ILPSRPPAVLPPQHLFSLAPARPASLFLSPALFPTDFYTLSLHDALPIFRRAFFDLTTLEEARHLIPILGVRNLDIYYSRLIERSEEHTSELQSRFDLVCRLLLEKKKLS